MNIDVCLNYTSETIENLTNIPDDKKKYYYDTLQNINRRKSDPFLNVALIGDFSSGKSTFINALIKQNMLKTAWKATTAIPTYIYYHNKKDIDIYIEAVDGRRYSMSLKKDRYEIEKIYGCKLQGDSKKLITLLTTTNEFADFIKLIKVYCPNDESFKDICIIDTPGVNPGDNKAKLHVVATRNVLREYADATVVLFSALQVYTNSFVQFLKENAEHFMDDAIFVITMMDEIDEGERDEILNFVKQSLKDSFGLENPMVFGCCAKNVNSSTVDEEKKIWCDKFDELRSTIVAYINERRETIIKKQISVLLKQLIGVLDVDIQQNLSRVSQELEILEKNSIEKMKEELGNTRNLYTQKINNAFDLGKIYDRMFSNIKDKARRDIYRCTRIRGDDNKAISHYMSNGLQIVIKSEEKAFSNRMEEELESITRLIYEYIDETETVFEKYSVNISEKRNAISLKSDNEAYSNDVGEVAYDGGNLLTVTAEIVGAVALLPLAVIDEFLGTELTDIAGWVLDSIIGTLINIFAKLEDKQREAIAKVESSIDSAKNNGRSKFKEQLQDKKNEITCKLQDVYDKFAEEYESIYDERYNAFAEEKEVLETEIAANTKTHERLSEYLELL